jgi:oxalate decarboxylase/phosphoglucose isomerase-like protein (cupin superfamily)
MDTGFDAIQQSPENSIFSIVFYPDRIYHAPYLNATRSSRYRYYVHQVRSQVDTTLMTGYVFFDGVLFANFLRIEYRASRLTEVVREKERFLHQMVLANVKLHHQDASRNGQAWIKLHLDPWINAYQAEVWDTLDAPLTKDHDAKVSNMMGRQGSITRVRAFDGALADVGNIHQAEIFFRENDVDLPVGYKIGDAQTDGDYGRTFQVPNTQTPSDPGNTVAVNCYLLDFQRGWFFQKVRDIPPVRYKNAMTENNSPDYNRAGPNDNTIEMRWVVQREIGGTNVYFHEVTIPPGTVEGTHQHIGSEELYYIFEGNGIAYMGDGDDPSLIDPVAHPLLSVNIFGLAKHNVRQVNVEPGSVIYTKSGGIHGIRNVSTDQPLRFVAFGYHSA